MTEPKSEALRLADVASNAIFENSTDGDAVVAELRRLHAENEKLTEALSLMREGCRTNQRLRTRNAELVEALKESVEYIESALVDHDLKYQRHPATESARSVIVSTLEQARAALARSKT